MLSQNKILTSDGQKRGENGAAGCVLGPLHWHLLYVWETSQAWQGEGEGTGGQLSLLSPRQ